MRAPESFFFTSQVAANSGTFELKGGAYVIDAVAQWGGGSITLQRLGPDNATFITAATAMTVNGTSGALALPPGTYQFAVTTAAALYVSVIRVPGE